MRLSFVLAAALLCTTLPSLAQTSIAPNVTYYPPGNPAAPLNNTGVSVMQPEPARSPSGPTVPPSQAGNPVTTPSVGFEDVPSAKDQGFGNQQDTAALRWALEEAAARNTPRQRGEVVQVPTLANPVGTDPRSRGWLANWELALQQKGVSLIKVRFEAGRLSREDFEAWASRQYRFRQGGQARTDLPVRSPVCEAGPEC